MCVYNNKNKNKNLRSVSVLCVIIAVTLSIIPGCSGDSSTGDTKPPVIQSFYPSRGQTDVPINAKITVTFNKSVVNINKNSFYLEKLNEAGKIPATIYYDDATNTVTLQPLQVLDYNAIYYVTLTSDIRSRAGVALQPESWAFVTGIEEDTIKPTIIDKSPQAQYYVDVNVPIYIVFSEDVVHVSSNTIYIKKNNTTLINAAVAYNSATKTAVITPAQPLEEWTDYTVYCTDSITDNAGNYLDYHQFSFKTDDKNNPIVISKYPIGEDIPTNTLIVVTFSESIKSYTVTNTTNFKLERNTGATWEVVDRTIIYNDSTKTATCYASLASGTTYRVTLSNDIRDLAHNPLQSILWEFTTADEPDITPPAITDKKILIMILRIIQWIQV